MTRADLMREWEARRLEAERHGATAPLARVYRIVLEELRALDSTPALDRLMTTLEAGRVLGVAPKTVAKWAVEGRFVGATKTSEGGEWRLPSRSVYELAGGQRRGENGATPIPKLWTEGDHG